MNRLALLITVSYPLLSHLAVLAHWPALQLLALVLLAGGVLMPRMGVRAGLFMLVGALCAAAAFASLVALTRWRDAAQAVAFAVPVLLHGVVGWAFARSLLPGREPLVTAIGRHARGTLPPEMQRYTRTVTQLWALLFAGMVILSLLLPLLSLQLWSWCTNVFNYVLFALVIAIEYICRRWRFPEHAHPDFVSYLQLLVRADVRRL